MVNLWGSGEAVCHGRAWSLAWSHREQGFRMKTKPRLTKLALLVKHHVWPTTTQITTHQLHNISIKNSEIAHLSLQTLTNYSITETKIKCIQHCSHGTPSGFYLPLSPSVPHQNQYPKPILMTNTPQSPQSIPDTPAHDYSLPTESSDGYNSTTTSHPSDLMMKNYKGVTSPHLSRMALLTRPALPMHLITNAPKDPQIPPTRIQSKIPKPAPALSQSPVPATTLVGSTINSDPKLQQILTCCQELQQTVVTLNTTIQTWHTTLQIRNMTDANQAKLDVQVHSSIPAATHTPNDLQSNISGSLVTSFVDATLLFDPFTPPWCRLNALQERTYQTQCIQQFPAAINMTTTLHQCQWYPCSWVPGKT